VSESESEPEADLEPEEPGVDLESEVDIEPEANLELEVIDLVSESGSEPELIDLVNLDPEMTPSCQRILSQIRRRPTKPYRPSKNHGYHTFTWSERRKA
jgi:hypothetical protein